MSVEEPSGAEGPAGARRVEVPVPGRPYSVWVGPGLLGAVGQLVPCPAASTRAVVIGDEHTAPLFGEPVTASLAAAGWQVARDTIPAGESSKSIEQACRLWRSVAAAGGDRQTHLFALGGGVVGDLVGFVAATYMRGVPFVQLPTSLTAQADAALGGKTGLDLPEGKNLVGAFHQPRTVIADTDALAFLPARELRSGCAEVVKHAALADAELFALLEARGPELLGAAGDAGLWPEVIARNAAIKAAVVARDPHEESGERAALNYGHTVGHALERAAAGWGLTHGEAVSLGMVAESRLAVELALGSAACARRLEALLPRLGLPVAIGADAVDVGAARAALRHDKKRTADGVLLPVVPEIGQVRLVAGVAPARLEEALLSVVQ